MERTLLIVKPDAVAQNVIGEIIRRLEEKNFRIADLKMVRLTHEQASEFYAVHRQRPFYNDLLDFMTSGPCVPLALERDNAVAFCAKSLAAPIPKKPQKAPFAKTLQPIFKTMPYTPQIHWKTPPKKWLSFLGKIP